MSRRPPPAPPSPAQSPGPTARRRAAFAVLWRTARSGTRPGTPGVGSRLASLPAMARDSVTGRYTGSGRSRLAVSAAGLLYLLSPVDALPEAFLPLVGLLDDGVVAAWVAGTLLVATEDYAAWRDRSGSRGRRGVHSPAATPTGPDPVDGARPQR